MTSSAAATMAWVFFSSCRPSAWLTTADARLTWASALMISRGCCSPEMSKFCSERCVCAPHSLSAGTSIGPKVSRSARVLGEVVMRKMAPQSWMVAPLVGRGAEYRTNKNGSHLTRPFARVPQTRYARGLTRVMPKSYN
ncbi:hypothetical protein D3C72_1550270 [compost metagenome]